MDRRSYGKRLLDATSQFINVMIFNGDPDESMSGRVYRTQRKPLIAIIDTLFFWQEFHCRGAYLQDLDRAKKRVFGSKKP